MPTYDYVCHHCGHRFEVIHGVHAEGPSTCPVCHVGPVRKAFSAPTIHFKGSGWAKKDRSATSRSAARASSASADTGSASGSDASTGAAATSDSAAKAAADGGSAGDGGTGKGSSPVGGSAAAD